MEAILDGQPKADGGLFKIHREGDLTTVLLGSG
jgi:hypothetical protein